MLGGTEFRLLPDIGLSLMCAFFSYRIPALFEKQLPRIVWMLSRFRDGDLEAFLIKVIFNHVDVQGISLELHVH